MSTQEIAEVYLQVLVTILVFGIGFPSFLYERPTWLRRIRDKYSVWNNLHKTLVVVIFTIAVIVTTYLFPGSIAKECSSKKILIIPIRLVVSATIVVAVAMVLWGVIGLPEQSRERRLVRWSRRSVKTFLAVGSIVLIGMVWAYLGKLFQTLSDLEFLKLRIRSNDLNILSILLIIAMIAVAVLWYRLYLFRFDTILGRLVEITECRYKKRRLCWNYWLLRIRYQWFDDKSSRSKKPLEDSIKDMGILGANAESHGDRLNVLLRLEEFVKLIDATEIYAPLTDAIQMTISGGHNTAKGELYSNAIDIIRLILIKVNRSNDTKTRRTQRRNKRFSSWLRHLRAFVAKMFHRSIVPKKDETTTEQEKLPISLALAQAMADIGSEALRHAANWQATRIKTQLSEAVKSMAPGHQAETLFRFGLAAQEGGHVDEALQLMDDLSKSQAPEHTSYWIGLLARLAADKNAGSKWAAAKVKASADDAHKCIEEALDLFGLLIDFETVDAIEALKPYVGA